MFSYIWPIGLVVLSNVIYQICAKSVPDKVSPYAALTVTYLVGAVCAAAMYFITGGTSPVKELTKMNWSPFALGVSIVGLEVGFIYAYRAGWQISTATVVQSSFLSVALIFVGALLFKEGISWNKITGITICLLGIAIINMK